MSDLDRQLQSALDDLGQQLRAVAQRDALELRRRAIDEGRRARPRRRILLVSRRRRGRGRP